MKVRITKSRQVIPEASPCTEHSLYSPISTAKQVETLQPVDSAGFETIHSEVISLNGQWKRKADLGTISADITSKTYDDFNWSRVKIPNNYGLEGELQRYFGPVWYRKKFSVPNSKFVELHFTAVDYCSEIWLNGQKLGTHEGYFAPFYFDITNDLENENVLVVKVTDPCENLDPKGDWVTHRKKYIKGTMNYHDSRPGGLPGKMSPHWTSEWGQSLTTGGITQSVYLKCTGSLSIFNIFITPLDLSGTVHLAIILKNKSEEKEKITLNLELTSPNSEIGESGIQAELSPGFNRIDIDLQIPNPVLWYPISAEYEGTPKLYQLKIQAIHNQSLSDEISTSFGIRTVNLTHDPWQFEVNTQPLFIKAINYIPRQHFADVNEAFYRRDMQLIKDAHLNSVGVHAHIQCKDCYDATDKEGIIVFQDFPLQWAYDSSITTNPGFREKACWQISEMVYFLYNHPSVVYWCCHNEPPALFMTPTPDEIEDYDNQVLDELLEETVKKIDSFRPVHRASGLGDDLHVYDGSLMGGSIYNARKRKSGFISEFGYWSIAETALNWGDVGWPPSPEELVEWSSRCSFFGSTSTFIGHPKYFSSRKEWIKASLLYGAFLAKYHTEIFRSQKGNPYNAIRWHFFSDWWGYAGGGLVDVDRNPKLPYYWYGAACRPLILIADLAFTIFPPNTALEIPIIAVNDYATKIGIAWEYELLEVNGSQIIAGDQDAAILGGTGASCKRNHKVALPLEEFDILRNIVKKQSFSELPPNSAATIDMLHFSTPTTTKQPSYFIQLKWTANQKSDSNWAHFLVGDLNAKMKPGLHIISAKIR